MIITTLHYNHSTIMQYFYMAMAIRRTIYIINVVCRIQMTTVNFNIVAVIFNLHNQLAINGNQFVTWSVHNLYNKGHSMINLTVIPYGSKALVTQLMHSMWWMNVHWFYCHNSYYLMGYVDIVSSWILFG